MRVDVVDVLSSAVFLSLHFVYAFEVSCYTKTSEKNHNLNYTLAVLMYIKATLIIRYKNYFISNHYVRHSSQIGRENDEFNLKYTSRPSIMMMKN